MMIGDLPCLERIELGYYSLDGGGDGDEDETLELEGMICW